LDKGDPRKRSQAVALRWSDQTRVREAISTRRFPIVRSSVLRGYLMFLVTISSFLPKPSNVEMTYF
jgi:hypothetical protein